MDAGADKTGLLARMMDAAHLRHQVLAHNLANQNTPGFRRSTVQFENLLREATGPGAAAKVQPTIVEDNVTPSGPDDNNVNLELELNAIRENQLLYDTYARILRSDFDLLQSAIRSR